MTSFDGLQTLDETLQWLLAADDRCSWDEPTLRALLDISRGYLMPRLVQASRLLPAVQPRFAPERLPAVDACVTAAGALVSRLGVGAIEGRLLSAHDETEALLRIYREVLTANRQRTPVHQSLVDWLDDQVLGGDSSVWRDAWNAAETFADLKRPCLLRMLADLDAHRIMGRSVLDIGAGRRAASDCLSLAGRKLVQWDIAATGEKLGVLLLAVDLEDTGALSRAIGETRSYIGADKVETIICSHVLNYVDYRRTLIRLQTIQAPGGRLVIFNQPFEGEAASFSPGGVRDNVELLAYLEGAGYALEYLQAAPCLHVNDYDADFRSKSLLAVARNRA